MQILSLAWRPAFYRSRGLHIALRPSPLFGAGERPARSPACWRRRRPAASAPGCRRESPGRRRRPAACTDRRRRSESLRLVVGSAPLVCSHMRQGRSGGALNGISISIRPVVPKMLTRWYGASCVPHVNVAVPWREFQHGGRQPIDLRCRVALDVAQHARPARRRR